MFLCFIFVVIEDEICCGIIIVLLFENYCFWFKRVIINFMENVDDCNVGKFVDKNYGVVSLLFDEFV